MVSRLLWIDVLDVFKIEINDFLSLASMWLCNKRFLQLNFVSSAILWSIWNNRNSIVFNRKTWLNKKQVWHLTLTYLREWRIPFKGQTWALVDQFIEVLIRKLKHRWNWSRIDLSELWLDFFLKRDGSGGNSWWTCLRHTGEP